MVPSESLKSRSLPKRLAMGLAMGWKLGQGLLQCVAMGSAGLSKGARMHYW